MLRLINGPVEILRKDHDTQGYPICDESGIVVGTGETYGHALEISEAVSNYNRALALLAESRKLMGSRGDKSRKIQHKIGKFLESRALVCA